MKIKITWLKTWYWPAMSTISGINTETGEISKFRFFHFGFLILVFIKQIKYHW